MSGLRVGWDYDDVIFPWYDRAHRLVVKAGRDGGVVPRTWYPWREYPGMEKDEWLEILDRGTLLGVLTGRGRPFPGIRQQMLRVQDAGHSNIVVTARGFFNHGPMIKKQTRDNIKTHRLPVDAVHFTQNKTIVRLDTMIDDNLRNFSDLEKAGVDVYLLTRPWNDGFITPRRVDTVEEYVDKVLAKAEVNA